MFSTVHSNFIVNVDNASSRDVFDLINLAIQLSKENLNIELVPEVEFFNWR